MNEAYAHMQACRKRERGGGGGGDWIISVYLNLDPVQCIYFSFSVYMQYETESGATIFQSHENKEKN